MTSLCGCGRMWQIEANRCKSMANLRKFWQIRCKKHLTAAISYAAPRNKFMLKLRAKLFDIGNRSLYNFYKSEELQTIFNSKPFNLYAGMRMDGMSKINAFMYTIRCLLPEEDYPNGYDDSAIELYWLREKVKT